MNSETGKEEKCEHKLGVNMVPILISWIMGEIYICALKVPRTYIPALNAMLTGLAAACASLFSIIAVNFTTFPVVVMVESSSILPVIFVAVFCSRVADQKLKLGPRKFITATLIVIGILVF